MSTRRKTWSLSVYLTIEPKGIVHFVLAKDDLRPDHGTVIYRSKIHAGLKRNFQLIPGAEWLALLCKHVPDRYEHLGLWVPLATERSLPLPAASWLRHANLPLTYHPSVPDIA